MMTPPFPRSRSRCGFSLVEVTLALGIMAFCIVPVIGLLPVGINTNQASINQTRAASVTANVCADVRGTATTATASSRFNVDLSQASSKTLYFSEAGDASNTVADATSRYRVVVTVTPGTGQAATWLNVVVTWPAAATTNPAGKYQSATAFNRS